jgi:hypothetical protein
MSWRPRRASVLSLWNPAGGQLVMRQTKSFVMGMVNRSLVKAGRPSPAMGVPVARATVPFACFLWQPSKMMNILRSRNAFMGRHVGNVKTNFWTQILKSESGRVVLAKPENTPLRGWAPVRSNCPELEREIGWLLSRMPNEYRASLANVFVGRTFSGDVNAQVRREGEAAWIELSFQYTSVIGAYVAAFDRFNDLARRRQVGRVVDDDEVFALFDNIAISRDHWAEESQFVGVADLVMSGPQGRGADFYSDAVLSGEMFILGHEYAHLLLGHNGKATFKRKARRDVNQLLENSALTATVQDHPAAQVEHLEADLLSLLLAEEVRTPEDTKWGY